MILKLKKSSFVTQLNPHLLRPSCPMTTEMCLRDGDLAPGMAACVALIVVVMAIKVTVANNYLL